MPLYRDKDTRGRPDDVFVIEDPTMLITDEDGVRRPGWEFIDAHAVRAHPVFIEALLRSAERLWTLEEILEELAD